MERGAALADTDTKRKDSATVNAGQAFGRADADAFRKGGESFDLFFTGKIGLGRGPSCLVIAPHVGRYYAGTRNPSNHWKLHLNVLILMPQTASVND
jgi:hypothetical protein